MAETFLKSLAEATGGACELVAPQEGLAERVLAQFHRMRQPRLPRLQLIWPTVPAWQTRLPGTVFAGDTVHVFAGFDGPVTGEVRLRAGADFEAVAPLLPAVEPEVPRLAAAARLIDAGSADGLSLALQYQLLSCWTNFLVVAQRADKSENLPQVQVVPQMLAAGWGGTGDPQVHADIAVCMPMRSNAAELGHYDMPAFLRRSEPDSSGDFCSFGGFADFMDPEPEGEGRDLLENGERNLSDFHTPQAFVTKLVAWFSKPHTGYRANGETCYLILPTTIEDLVSLGLPLSIADSLWAMGTARWAHHVSVMWEPEIVPALLWALAESRAGSGLPREARRRIFKGWKEVAPPPELDARMRHALKHVEPLAWNWTETPEEVGAT